MYRQIVLNLTVAFVWMFFFDEWDISTFILGYLLGMGIIFVLRRFSGQTFYMQKVFAVVRLILLLFKELLTSSWAVLVEILRPKMKIHPGIIAVPIELKSEWELTIFAMLVTLTPGTLALEVSTNNDVVFVHSMNIENTEAAIDEIKSTFETAIKEVTRI